MRPSALTLQKEVVYTCLSLLPCGISFSRVPTGGVFDCVLDLNLVTRSIYASHTSEVTFYTCGSISRDNAECLENFYTCLTINFTVDHPITIFYTARISSFSENTVFTPM